MWHDRRFSKDLLNLPPMQHHQRPYLDFCAILHYCLTYLPCKKKIPMHDDSRYPSIQNAFNHQSVYCSHCTSSHSNVIINAFFSCSSDSLNNDAQDGPTPPLCTWRRHPHTVLMPWTQFAYLMRSDACTFSVVFFSRYVSSVRHDWRSSKAPP